MRPAVCLLTADRERMTDITIDSFTQHNNPDRYIFLHADDGSETDENQKLASEAGFRTCYASKKRKGQIPAIRSLVRNARNAGATHILYLENDWLSMDPIPFGTVRALAHDVECIRLYGKFKRSIDPRQKTGEHVIGTKERVRWVDKKGFPGWEVGMIHWGGPPSLVRADLITAALIGATRIRDLNYGMRRLITARPKYNIVEHIGLERTPEFVDK